MNQLSIFVVTLASLTLSQVALAGPPPTCTAESVASCAQLAAAPANASGNRAIGLPASQTGEVVFNSYATFLSTSETAAPGVGARVAAEIATFANPSPAQVRAGLAQAESLRQEAIQMIAGDTRQDSLTTEQRALIRRLRTLQISLLPNDDDVCSLNAAPGLPNAGYQDITHSLQICPSMLKQTPAFIANAIGHELGHVVSPCKTAKALFQVNREKTTRSHVNECAPDYAPLEGENEGQDGVDSLLVQWILVSDARHVTGDANTDLFAQLSRCQIVSPLPDSNPPMQMFTTTNACVIAKTRSAYDRRSAFEARDISFARGISPEDAERSYRSSNPPSCLGAAQEQFSDSFAAKLVGRIASAKRWTAGDTKTALILHRGNVCSETDTGDQFRDSSAYPSALTRVNTLLNNPDIAIRLGCAPASTPDVCPMVFDQPAGTRASPARSAPTTTPRSSTRSAH